MDDVQYWVCPSGKHDDHGELVDNFEDMRHFFYFFSNDADAEVWTTGFSKRNVTEKFLEMEKEYRRLRGEFKIKLDSTLYIPLKSKY